MRVVFDTNIFVLAAIFPGSKADNALQRVISGNGRLIVSKPIINELLGVLARKFRRNPEELSRLALYLADIGELVEPDHAITVLSDDPETEF